MFRLTILRVKRAAFGLGHLLSQNSLVSIVKFFASRLAKKQRLLPLRVGGVPLLLRTLNSDLVTARLCLVAGEFEDALNHVEDPNAPLFIIDAGGYIGTAAIALAKMFPNSTIVSLEPSEENFAILQQNVSPYPNIIAVNAALDAEDGEKQLFDRKTGEWGFSIAVQSRDFQPIGMTRTLSIPTLMAEYKMDRIDILKLDIEGAEQAVFSSSAEWIDKVGMLYVELHDRIKAGCTEAYLAASSGMTQIPKTGEKHIAIRSRNPASASTF